MMSDHPNIAIVDYGMGNLYSVQLGCERAGARGEITSEPSTAEQADAIILPGVGAFGDAIAELRRTGMADALVALVRSGKPLFGICLGFQLLMTESFEFGRHRGLGLIEGAVVRLSEPKSSGEALKVPQVGWNRVWRAEGREWEGTPLAGLPDGSFMYFVHSFVVVPAIRDVALSVTWYGDTEFCSSISRDNLFACQFHPERSGPAGLEMYRNFVDILRAGGHRALPAGQV